MAITEIEYYLWRTLADNKVFAPRPDVLEIGEANWYGDVPLDRLAADIPRYASAERADELLQALASITEPARQLFDIAKIFYRTFLDYQSIAAIDMHGTPGAFRYDLNHPVPVSKRFHITVNNGTTEHIFNQYQVFKTIHERTRPGGLMLHVVPFAGWLDHGFYNYNPTFLADLAASNDYSIPYWIYGELAPLRIVQIERVEQVHEMARRGELGSNASLGVVFQKASEERPFVVPMQGVYAGKLSARAQEDWANLR